MLITGQIGCPCTVSKWILAPALTHRAQAHQQLKDMLALIKAASHNQELMQLDRLKP